MRARLGRAAALEAVVRTALALAFVGSAATAGWWRGTAPPGQAGGGIGPAPVDSTAAVVLLHGLGRTERSMALLERALAEAGYRVHNVGYPSRSARIDSLVDTLAVEVGDCCGRARTLHFVTHSLGGILVRAYAAAYGSDRIGRVVMLSPPNEGTAVVDHLPDDLLRLLLGPAAVQLGTDSTSVPLRLPPPDFEVGIITGDATTNPLFSWWIPGDDDGKVSVESARLDAAADFLVVPYSHTFIMRRERVIEQVLAFLEAGRFADDS